MANFNDMNEMEQQEFLKRESEKMRQKMASATVHNLSIRDKKFHLPNGKTVDSLDVVIVDWTLINMMYEKPYQMKSRIKQLPACFACGQAAWNTDLKPHPNVPVPKFYRCADPDRTNGDGCPNSKWGTGPGGNGRKCNNKVKLALISVAALKAGHTDPGLVTVECPSRNLKTWREYVDTVKQRYNAPPYRVLTRLTFEDFNYPMVKFGMGDLHKWTEVAINKQNQAAEILARCPELEGDGSAMGEGRRTS